MIKEHPACADDYYVTYQAEVDGLPSALPGTFDDGRTHFGQAESVKITEMEPNQHIEINLRYIGTTIVIRHYKSHLSVSVTMPEEIMNRNSSTDSDRMQLCTTGCPQVEKINYSKLLGQSDRPSGTVVRNDKPKSVGTGLPSVVMLRRNALQICRQWQLTDFYLDSCVFDLMVTGSAKFTDAAYYAHQDMLRLFPDGASLLDNRTSLEPYTNPPSDPVVSLATAGPLLIGRQYTNRVSFTLLLLGYLIVGVATVRVRRTVLLMEALVLLFMLNTSLTSMSLCAVCERVWL